MRAVIVPLVAGNNNKVATAVAVAVAVAKPATYVLHLKIALVQMTNIRIDLRWFRPYVSV